MKTTKKMKITSIVLLCVLVVVPVFGYGYSVNRKEENQIRNVFEEIFYVEASYITYSSFTGNLVRSEDPLSKVAAIDNSYTAAPRFRDFDFVCLPIGYNKHLPTDVEALSYEFEYKIKKKKVDEMTIGMERKISDSPEVTVSLFFVYDPEENYIRRVMRVFSDPFPGWGMQETEKSLQKYGLTIEEMESWSEDILKNRIVKDWLSVYDSAFTTEDMGEFSIQTEWN